MPVVTGYTSHKNKAATPDMLGTIFHLFNYMYCFINGIILYTLFLLFNLGSFGEGERLSSAFFSAHFIFILLCNYGACKVVNLLLVAALVSTSKSLNALNSHCHLKKYLCFLFQ